MKRVKNLTIPLLTLLIFSISILTDCKKGLISPEDDQIIEQNPSDTIYFTVEGIKFSNGNIDDINYTSARIKGDFASIAPQTAPITQYGHVWTKAPNSFPSITDVGANRTTLGSRTQKGQFTSLLNELEPGTQYYVRAYIEANGTTQYHSRSTSFSTLQASAPIVEIGEVTDITQSSFVIKARIQADGGANIEEHGFVWSKENQAPTLGNNGGKIAFGGTSSGSQFNTTIENLNSSSFYYVRAYAVNFFGTSYSQIKAVRTDSPYAVDEGLIAYYRFDEDLKDVLGTFNGTNHEVEFSEDTRTGVGFSGKFIPAAQSYFSTALNPLFQVEEGTVSFWVKTTSSSNQCIIHCDRIDTYSGFAIVLSSEVVRYNGAPLYTSGNISSWRYVFNNISNELFNGQWHHITISIKPDEHRFYLDGDLAQNYNGSDAGVNWNSRNNGMQVGRFVDFGDRDYFFSGLMDNLRFYDRVISSEEVKEIYNANQ